MKSRNKSYIEKQKAIRNMIAFKDLKSFLFGSFIITNSQVVKKDIINLLQELNIYNNKIITISS